MKIKRTKIQNWNFKEKNCINCNQWFKPTNGRQITCNLSCNLKRRINYKKRYNKSEHFVEYTKQYYLKNKDRIDKRNREYYQKNKERAKETAKRWRRRNKEKIKELSRRWRKDNPNRKRQTDRLYYKNNKEKMRKYYREYQKLRWVKDKINLKLKKRRKEDILFRVRMRLRCLFRHAMRKYTETGKIFNSEKYGIDYGAIIEHLKPFPENLSIYHIDHIEPLCSFDLTDSEQIKQAFAPENHQWLLAKDNIIKSNRERGKWIK